MAKKSAGLLMYKRNGGRLTVLLAHPGGPFWARKDAGAWTIPKGELDEGEDPLDGARREFAEEIGTAPEGTFIPLGEVRRSGAKTIIAWAVEGDFDPAMLLSNRFALEWPPRSGIVETFPEVDRAAWFGLEDAREKLNPRQVPFLDRLAHAVGGNAWRPGGPRQS